MLLSTLVFLLSTQAGCRTAAEAGEGPAVLSLDLDGDQVPDEVRVADRQVELRRSNPRSVTTLDLTWGDMGPAHNRHAWLYVLDRGVEKLRHKSVGEVAISKGLVSIELTLELVPTEECVEAQVRLEDGAIKIVRGKRPKNDPMSSQCIP